ncbi:flagellar hook-basal body complex protein FliE [Lentibacillus persicus]|uniref:Flagellar hook-basal body complex protein FliE n=1 Tax=Lentibacillus persicus TaxID=640948 RepID=A0A1I1VCW8_9BACI|nr:flagellar hook-basal body complex protein FliE [Lentibacillus persicus]SFD80719.1 flagellar hook-basal body complex protein FliE [Lentibacillus persicus]
MSSFLNGVNDTQALTAPKLAKQAVSPSEAHNNFAQSLESAINKVNEAQNVSDEKTEAIANGEIEDLHDVMITAQKASITLETSVQVQGKVIDAYNKIMRMQI